MKIRFRKRVNWKIEQNFFSPGKGSSDNKVIYIQQNKINEVILLSVFSSAVCRCNKSSWLAEQGGILEAVGLSLYFWTFTYRAHEQIPFPDSFSAILFMLSSSLKKFNHTFPGMPFCTAVSEFLSLRLSGALWQWHLVPAEPLSGAGRPRVPKCHSCASALPVPWDCSENSREEALPFTRVSLNCPSNKQRGGLISSRSYFH